MLSQTIVFYYHILPYVNLAQTQTLLGTRYGPSEAQGPDATPADARTWRETSCSQATTPLYKQDPPITHSFQALRHHKKRRESALPLHTQRSSAIVPRDLQVIYYL